MTKTILINSKLSYAGIYNPVDNFGVYGLFSNNAWGTCSAIIWIPHNNNLKYSLNEVVALGDGDLSTIITSKCTIDSSRTQYFIVTCSDTSVAHKYVSISIKATS